MDETDKLIQFDDNGVCNHCHEYDRNKKLLGYDTETSPKKHNQIITLLKQNGKKKEYDCILGLSGGVDSSYLLHHAVKNGLRVLAVHVDAGWNSEIAVKNIHKLCEKLNVELHTIVIDWPTIRELQRAYMFSGLPNLDIPQDHVFLAAIYDYARKNKIKYLLNGSNLATEGILPRSWGYSNIDFKSIQDVFHKFKRKGNLNKYPHFGLLKYIFCIKNKIIRIDLLNYINYSKKLAIYDLEKFYHWEYYGGKHFESRFTKFFQSYYLTTKFNYDKRLAHLSSLIVGGEISRDEALDEYLNKKPYNEESLIEDRNYILKKLGISFSEWGLIMASENKNENDYKNNKKMIAFIKNINIIKNGLFSSLKGIFYGKTIK
jgi:N-acetyl sugar amidotransferase